MIIEESGNLFESHYQTFGVTVNAFGAMGAGIALECRERFPEVYDRYAAACARRHFEVNQLLNVPVNSARYPGQHKHVLCILTKYHWRQPSRLAIVEASLQAIRDNYQKLKIESLAIPLLGCGHGKLDPHRVQPIIEAYLDPLPIKVGLFLSK
jgi:O-acetyl-ADP-ribose deacetylase (regulator of RNase III)